MKLPGTMQRSGTHLGWSGRESLVFARQRQHVDTRKGGSKVEIDVRVLHDEAR